MQFFGSMSGVLLAAVVSIAPFSAAARIADDQPAEFPPASYSGAQYVDSKGCIYVRAGYAGQVNWVPRVSRDRKALCGFKPTFAAATPQPAPQPAPKVAAPSRTAPLPTVALTTEMPVATMPAKTPTRVIAQTQAAPVVRYSAPVAAAAAPVRAAPVAAKPVKVIAAPAASERTAGGFDGCSNLSPTARHYTKAPAGVSVRCGPQAGGFGGYVIQTVPAGTTVQTASGRVYTTDKPVKVRIATSASTNTTLKPPKGYKSAFKDDRLNPQRGPRTAQGDAQMAQIWSDGTPRAMVAKPVPTRTAAVRIPPATRVSTKSVAVASAQPTRAAVPAVTGGAYRYVQVGTFGEPANAARTTARLKGMGYPVSMSTIRKGNKTLQIVLAGPFTAQAQLNSALNGARAAGFRDAFPRR